MTSRKPVRFGLQRTLRYYYLRFIRLKGDPGTLARGVAIGSFIGVTPTIPFHTILVLVLAILFRASKVAGILLSWLVSNPLTFFPQYYLAWKIGTCITPYKFSWPKVQSTMDLLSNGSFLENVAMITHLGREIIICMVAGGIVLALPVATLLYFLSKAFFIRLERNRLEKQQLV